MKSADALVDFNSALSRVQTDYRVGKREARFAKIASLLRELPILCSQEEALRSTLELITSQRSRNTLQQVIELSSSSGIQAERIESTTLL